MKKLLLLLIIIISLFSCSKNDNSNKYNYFVNVLNSKTITSDEINQMITNALTQANVTNEIETKLSIIGGINSIQLTSISYKTKNVDGKEIVASGVIAYPLNTEKYAKLTSIQHVTIDINDAPSDKMFNYELLPAALGKMVIMADYLGYGISRNTELKTPFMHLYTTGVNCADMILAAKEYLRSINIKCTADSIELVGYSQGGTAAIATLMEMENRGYASDISSVDAGGAIMDLPATMNYLIAQGIYKSSEYIPFIIRGLEYGDNLSIDYKNIYGENVLNNLQMFSTMQLSQWHSILGSDLHKIINADFFNVAGNYNNNKDILTLIESFKNNSLLLKSEPECKINLYHSKKDEVIPYETNAAAAKSKWANINLIQLSGESHAQGCIEFYLKLMHIL